MANGAREAILARVRQGLSRPAPPASWDQADAQSTDPLFALPDATVAARLARFQQEFEAIQGEYIQVDSIALAKQWLAEWVARESLTRLLAHDDALLRNVLGDQPEVEWKTAPADTTGWDDAEVGITRCEMLVAETGGICVSATQSGRALSVLPPIHLVVATADQVVGDLADALAQLDDRYSNDWPSALTFIAGPSRTADIEKILVLGAHGPKRLLVLVLPANTT